MNFNQIIIVGRITRDIELRATKSGGDVASFGVATNRNWKDKDGEKQSEVEFHNVVAFGKVAEVLEKYFSKGDEIMVTGYLKTSKWESKDGAKRERTEIILEKFEFGQKKRGSDDGSDKSEEVDNEVDNEKEEVDKGDDINIDDIQF